MDLCHYFVNRQYAGGFSAKGWLSTDRQITQVVTHLILYDPRTLEHSLLTITVQYLWLAIKELTVCTGVIIRTLAGHGICNVC